MSATHWSMQLPRLKTSASRSRLHADLKRSRASKGTAMDGVVYMLAGSRRAAQLTVSVMSLRDHWDGSVTILTHDAAGREVGQQIAADKRLEVSTSHWHPPKAGRGKGHHQGLKPLMGLHSPFDRSIFLDTDTLVVGDITDLLPVGGEVRLTRFCNWKSTGSKIRGRIAAWKDICPDQVAEQLGTSYPAINTGTLGFSTQCARFMRDWYTTTQKLPRFMCDEIAAQLLYPSYPHEILDHRWNYSPKFSPEVLPWEGADARIVHLHGWSTCRPAKTKLGCDLWMAQYDRAISANVAGIADWGPGTDRHLKLLLETRVPVNQSF